MSDVIRLEKGETESTISNLSNYETDISKSLTDMSEVMATFILMSEKLGRSVSIY